LRASNLKKAIVKMATIGWTAAKARPAMAELTWFSISPPRDVDLPAVTAAIRSLASRPRLGMPPTTPIVVVELWSLGGELQWLLGVDPVLANQLPTQLQAHIPRLALTWQAKPERPHVAIGTTIHTVGMAAPLRTDVAGAISAELYGCLTQLHQTETVVLQWILGPAQPRAHLPESFDFLAALGIREKRKPDTTMQRLFRQKAAEPLFAAVGRIGAMAAHPGREHALIQRIGGALKLANAEHAGFRLSPFDGGHAQRLVQASSPAAWTCVLSASEIASVLGWPVQADVSDDLPLAGGHVSLVPQGLLAATSPADGRSLGESLHPSQRGQQVIMPVRSGAYHLHVIGPTGSGKSTLLTHLILADITAGRGALVMEPRGDLVQDVLARIPADRRDDVVVVDPADQVHGVVGVNILAGPRETAERRADELVGLLSAMHGSNWGPRTADVAFHAILSASRMPDGTLPDVVALLTNSAFRRRALAMVSDPLTLGPWWAAFDGLSDGERSQHIAPLLNKLRGFLSRDVIRQMLGQPQSAFNFDDLFVKRRIVLINLNRGLLGGPTANLLGALFLSSAWAALQRRASLAQDKRHVVGLYVDELQDYVGLTGSLDFGDALAQSRGLGGAWTLSHQNLGQLSGVLESAMVANARSRISFRPSTSDAKALAAMFGRLTAEDLLRLNAYKAVAQIHVDGRPSVPFGIRTNPLDRWTTDPAVLRQASASTYGADGAAVDQALTDRWHGQKASDSPIGTRPRRRT
jgi:hypothetical protein